MASSPNNRLEAKTQRQDQDQDKDNDNDKGLVSDKGSDQVILARPKPPVVVPMLWERKEVSH